MDPTRLQGLTVPLVTPFDGQSIDWDSFDAVLSHVVDAGVDAVFPCGTTGEVASLSTEERIAVIERAVAHVPSEMTVMAGGTGTDLADARSWLECLDESGVDVAVVTGPYFHTSNDPAGLELFFSQLAADSPLPILLYNIPACVGEEIPVDVVTSLAEEEAIIGLKDSSGSLDYGLDIIGRTPSEFVVLQGYDTLLLASMRTGFDGGVNALANVLPESYIRLVNDPDHDDASRIHHQAISPLFAHCRRDGFAPAAKAGLVSMGILSSSTVRPPLVSIAPDQLVVDLAEL